jgi:hypothetical protein
MHDLVYLDSLTTHRHPRPIGLTHVVIYVPFLYNRRYDSRDATLQVLGDDDSCSSSPLIASLEAVIYQDAERSKKYFSGACQHVEEGQDVQFVRVLPSYLDREAICNHNIKVDYISFAEFECLTERQEKALHYSYKNGRPCKYQVALYF